MEREKTGVEEECQKIKCAKRVSDEMNERRIADLREALQQVLPPSFHSLDWIVIRRLKRRKWLCQGTWIRI